MCDRSCRARGFFIPEFCDECMGEAFDKATADNAFALLCSKDPAADPTCREATDAEWWAHLGAFPADLPTTP